MQADKYQMQKTEIPKTAFAKVSINLIVELPDSHYMQQEYISNG